MAGGRDGDLAGHFRGGRLRERVLEGSQQLVEFALNDLVKVLPFFVDPVVGDAVLREVVGADLFGPHASADSGAVVTELLLFFRFFHLPKLGF